MAWEVACYTSALLISLKMWDSRYLNSSGERNDRVESGCLPETRKESCS